jgi:cytochrome b561
MRRCLTVFLSAPAIAVYMDSLHENVPVDPQGISRLQSVLAYLVHWTLYGRMLVLAHIAAALWHQFVARDGLLRRMWFGGVY